MRVVYIDSNTTLPYKRGNIYTVDSVDEKYGKYYSFFINGLWVYPGYFVVINELEKPKF